jgi:hypothetical protein
VLASLVVSLLTLSARVCRINSDNKIECLSANTRRLVITSGVTGVQICADLVIGILSWFDAFSIYESAMPNPILGGSILRKIFAINSNAMPDMANLTKGPFTHVKYCFFGR